MFDFGYDTVCGQMTALKVTSTSSISVLFSEMAYHLLFGWNGLLPFAEIFKLTYREVWSLYASVLQHSRFPACCLISTLPMNIKEEQKISKKSCRSDSCMSTGGQTQACLAQHMQTSMGRDVNRDMTTLWERNVHFHLLLCEQLYKVTGQYVW